MRTFLLALLVLTAGLPAGEISAEHLAFFEQRVRPVLVEHCYECHSAQAKKIKGNLLLDSRAGWEKGGDAGETAIKPGYPDESLFIQAVRHDDRDTAMPPNKPRLPDAVIADLIAWVKMGAPDPRGGAAAEARRADKQWWSLQPIRREFAHDSIDDYVVAGLAGKGLTLNPPAEPRALIRRMTYDLHGLPPSSDEVAAFDADFRRDSQAAVRTLVDRLLASPRYGERWGRHWLDVVRFGESNGFERNFIIDDLWPFRDYVVRSLNEDKAMDRFIIEHLAGDVVGKDDPAVEVGSAFLVAGPYDDVGNADPGAQANIRAATLDDMITATGSAFLGITIHCARCHHHKFDPMPTEDYYRIRAAFEGVTHGRRVVATKAEQDAHAAVVKPLNAELAAFTRERDALDKTIDDRARTAFASVQFSRPKIDPHGTEETFAPVEAKFVRFVMRAFTGDPKSKDNRRGGGGKLTEFQVWSTDGRNVALASEGTKAAGAKSATAEDFPEAYGPQYCIDGALGEAWFIGDPPVLTLTLGRAEKIIRITFINARGDRGIDESRVRGATPVEYEIQVSNDGSSWRTVATDEGREPWTAAHGVAKARREVITASEAEKLLDLDRRIRGIEARLAKVPKLREVWAGKYAQPKERTFVHKGGDPMKPADAVLPASLSLLDGVTKPYALAPDAPEGERRLALARWITAVDNPLTPRVLANRVWHYHFGMGLVDTPSDFGFLGSKPTHPELLDFLAQRLLSNGWKLKALHREILLSKTYQQSSRFRAEGASVDKDSRLLWRFPPRRLSAEEVRDTILMVAGVMKFEPMGGPGFRLYKFSQNNVCTYFPLDVHGPETYRRAVYHQNARASVVDVLNDFDLPDIAFAAPKRANTTTPMQALALLNHSFTLDMARAFAARIGRTRASGETLAQVRDGFDPIAAAYAIAFQREPSANERAAAQKLMDGHGSELLCRALLNANELIYLE